jgi:hypothetical protein
MQGRLARLNGTVVDAGSDYFSPCYHMWKLLIFVEELNVACDGDEFIVSSVLACPTCGFAVNLPASSNTSGWATDVHDGE